jgi:hypothetical protein
MLMVHVVDLMIVVKTTICGKFPNISRVAPLAYCENLATWRLLAHRLKAGF